MTEDEKTNIIEKISNAIVSYLRFTIAFKNLKTEKIQEITSGDNYYSFRLFKTQCYFIDKDSFNEFSSSVNLSEMLKILKPINEKNIIKLKEELKKYFEENPFQPIKRNVKIFYMKEEMKEVVRNFGNYTFVNKEFLVDGMGVPEDELKNNFFRASKNKTTTFLKPLKNDYTFKIKFKSNQKEKTNKIAEPIEEIIKKFLILLYFNEQRIKNKIKKNVKDVYNFKHYYLIKKDWLNDFKRIFKYEEIINALNLENKRYSYVKFNLTKLIKEEKLKNIKLEENDADKKIKNGSYLIPKMNKIETQKIIKDNNEYYQETIDPDIENKLIEAPYDFEIVSDDIFEPLIRGNFFYL